MVTSADVIQGQVTSQRMQSTAQTIAFIDLSGSTAAYQALGNEEVAGVISKVTHWIGQACEAHEGRIVKFLGDGVLAEFKSSASAVSVAVFLQRHHSGRIRHWPEPLRMGLKIGLALGPVVRMGDDSYGDAVNLAARLSDMGGANEIWATESVIKHLRGEPRSARADSMLEFVRYRPLGMIDIRGIAQPHSIYQVEWSDEVTTELMTVCGGLQEFGGIDFGEASSNIELTWLDANQLFLANELPIEFGRAAGCAFVVNDQRVSRRHARIEWINGAFILTDLSTYGTWVRFSGEGTSETHLRRNQCVLHSSGEMALGAPFSDPSTPILSFHVSAGQIRVRME